MKNTDLKPDRREARAFFEAIRPAEQCTFQTFDDSSAKRSRLVRVLHGAEQIQQLARLNAASAGVFTSVNEMRGGRKMENVVAINTIFADFDKGAPTSIPIEPTLKVQTSICTDSGVIKQQWWWRLHAGEILTSEAQRAIMACLVDMYGADPNAKDAARVGRLSGFWHMKGKPQLVRIIGGTGELVRKRDMVEAFPAPPEQGRLMVQMQRSLRAGDRYLEGAARSLRDEVANAPEGSRNACLNYAAFRLAQLGAPDAAIAGYLAPAAEAAGLQQTEIKRTIASGIAGAKRRASA